MQNLMRSGTWEMHRMHSFLSLRILSYQEVVFRDGKGDGQKRAVARQAAQKAWTGDAPLVRNMDGA